jgi:hypothetical protein
MPRGMDPVGRSQRKFRLRGSLPSMLELPARHARAGATVFYVFHSQTGDWVIDASQPETKGCELHWHGCDGTCERRGVYRDLTHAAGAVQCQVTGVDCWDLLPQVPQHIADPSEWERFEHYPGGASLCPPDDSVP